MKYAENNYVKWARDAIAANDANGTPLEDSVVRVVKTAELNEEQTRRLVERTNTMMHMHRSMKMAESRTEHRYVEFTAVDPESVIEKTRPVKLAAAEYPQYGLRLVPNHEFLNYEIKTASELAALEKNASYNEADIVDDYVSPYKSLSKPSTGLTPLARAELIKQAQINTDMAVLEHERASDALRAAIKTAEYNAPGSLQTFIEDAHTLAGDLAPVILKMAGLRLSPENPVRPSPRVIEDSPLLRKFSTAHRAYCHAISEANAMSAIEKLASRA